MKLAVFYHLAALNHLWKDFIDEQLGLIKQVGLTNVAKTYVCYVAPDEYFDEVRDYLNKEYSFATVLSSRRTTEENLYEGQTLKELQEYSKNNDGYVLYLHSKGVLHSINSYQTIPTRDWRHYMNYWMIEQWKDCVKKLEDVSVVGTNYNSEPYPHLSGNFWWATTDYIRTLPDVLNRSLYYDESLTEKLAGHTFSYEMWVLYNKPKVDLIHCSHTNHYLQPYPREKYARLENSMLNYRNEKKTEKTITVFYHFYIPDTNNMWVWWVDEQMSLLKSVGLADKAKINMCMTLPLGLYNSKTGHSYDEMVIGYIKDRYPFVNIIDIRPTGQQPNLYEMQTLLKLHDFSQKNNSYVLYFHNKGMSSYSKNEYPPGTIHDWRKYLEYFLIENYEQCLRKLDEGYDYVSVDEIEWEYKFGFTNQPKYKHLMGNFWWSNTDYIRNLGNPTNFLVNYEKAINNKINFNSQEDFNEFYRLSSELWIHLNRPKCFYIHNSNVNNYFEYYPKEKYLEN